MTSLKNKIGFRVFAILSLAMMCFIFYMSSQNGAESENSSHWMGRLVAEHVVPGYQDMSEKRQEKLVLELDHPIRKGAHMTEYGVLALLLLGAVANYHKDRFALVPKNAKVDYFIAFVLTALYAASDEFHQTFVSGRSGQPLDVLIDSFGAIIFLIICYMIASYVNKR